MDGKVEIKGEWLELMPERAMFWRAAGTLFIADTHFGKAATFRAAGIPLPDGGTQDDLDRLQRAIDRTQPNRLVILGDFLHSRGGREPQVFQEITEWREHNVELDIQVIRGNHDRHAGDPERCWGMTCLDAPHSIGPFLLTHYPTISEMGYVLAGHLHPRVRLSGIRGERLLLPCFWITDEHAVLPAFSTFTDGGTIRPGASDQVFAIVEDTVAAVYGGIGAAEGV